MDIPYVNVIFHFDTGFEEPENGCDVPSRSGIYHWVKKG